LPSSRATPACSLFKGTNGRWRDVFEPEDLALYEEAKARLLTPESAEWLEEGWLG
jgi:hypothetical protein